MHPDPPASLVTPDDLSQERALRLARIVGRAAAVFVLLFFTGTLLATFPYLLRGPRVLDLIFGGGTLASYGLIGSGIWFARHNQGDWAARNIVTGLQVALTVCQVVWLFGHGLDAVVIASFMIHFVPIGLSYVLSAAPLLFITTGVTTSITAGFFFLLTPQVTTHFLWGEAIGSWGIIVLIAWLIALLVYGSAVLYDQTLEELGSIQQAYQRARQLDDLKDQFITHVNHELRTPIMTLQGTIDFLYDAREHLPKEAQADLLVQARRNTGRLVTMLASILDTRQIEQATLVEAAQAIGLQPLLRLAWEIVDPQGQRAVDIQIPPHLEVWGDPMFLQQILVNLLGNALKYSAAPAPIAVTARVLPRQTAPKRGTQHLVEVAIHDHGLGIPPEQIPLLFHRFVRLSRDLASNVPGSGVGLYLSQKLAQAMQGTVRVESTGIAGEGSTFFLTLPIPPRQDQETAPHPQRPKTRGKRRAVAHE